MDITLERLSPRAAAALVAVALSVLPDIASAEAPIRYIASHGKDSSDCRRAAPCRTLQRGIDMTPVGGELRVVDSGSYGLGIIGSSLTIAGGGKTVFGNVRVVGANATVAIRDINLYGAGRREIGIHVVSATAFHIEHCMVERYTGHGVISHAKGVELYIANSILRDNGENGLVFQDTSNPTEIGTAKLAADTLRLFNNRVHGALLYKTTATITRSTISGNGVRGIEIDTGAASISDTSIANHSDAGLLFFQSTVDLESVVSASNQTGLFVGDSTVTVSNSAFVNNTAAGIINAGTVLTRENNTIANNGEDIRGDVLTSVSGM